ncbi:MAG: acyl-CoA dehydratase activase [Smithellaceae bacterium]
MGIIAAGVDVGSSSTKVVIVDGRCRIVSYSIISYITMPDGFTFKGAAEDGMKEALQSAGLSNGEVSFAVSTGLGKGQVAFADQTASEITCRALGTKALLPEVHTILDIGGQSSNVIYLNDDGSVAEVVKKDKCMSGTCRCAAGTGYFLAAVAAALQVDWQELGELSLHSKTTIEIGDICTMPAGAEVVSLYKQGSDRADIAAAAHRYVARRIAGMVELFGVRESVGMIGGVAKNAGICKALEEKLHTTILIPEEPQIADAYGAAIIAAEQLKNAQACG